MSIIDICPFLYNCGTIQYNSFTKLAKLLLDKINLVASMPKVFTFFGDYRLYSLKFGSSGYAILYDYTDKDELVLLRIKHQKESWFI